MKALNKIKEGDLLAFDIETARSERVLQLDTPMYESWSYKQRGKGFTDLEVINNYQTDASLFAEFSRVVSVVLGMIKDGKIHTVIYDDLDEHKLLTNLNNHFNKLLSNNPRLILTGWNIKGFDMPFLFKRMIINGIEPSTIIDVALEKPWNLTALCLMELWKGSSFTNSSLLSVTTALNLPSPKESIIGSEVSEAFWNGRIKEISEYCRRDTESVLNIYRKLTLQEPLKTSTKPVEIKTEKLPILTHLFNGGNYGKKEKDELQTKMKGMSDSDKAKAKVILNAMVSTAKGKQTSLTKKDVKVL